ncbi:cellulase family glycosylhydrolase [Niabella hibiscisoli]|uniref:cellulase family glycosylhydrolase n=1 Tax=Niabella hibiscisoli TaxID=1825928 RepID=UPI001F0F51C6|nr:cellulase family glycosylhydrolase [Niabella hibiscisoli]MCH5719639.1 cellulase family glycosylhydrolase [Niabella hibiscisoli]
MIKFVRGLLLVTISLPGISSSMGQGFLKAEGKRIVDNKGKEIILRGMGLGGWMLQEGYMYSLSNLGQQYRIREKIEASVGTEKAAEFYERWLTTHTTKKDIDALASLGFNSIRLPMHYALYTLPVDKEPVAGKDTWLEKGFALTDSLLKWCGANKIYLILDLHAAPGGQGNDLAIADRDPAKPSLWESDANRNKTIALWRKLAARYATEPWIGGYDILNETNWGFQDAKDTRGTNEQQNIPLRKLSEDITKAIREVDTQHLIIIEGNGFGNNYRGMLPPWDSNMALSFHKYGNFNTTKTIQHFLDLRDQYNIPIWLGESGENSNTWFSEAIKLCEENGIGWAWWQHKKMNINNPFEIKRPEGYDKLLADWSGKGPKLPKEEAWNILDQWLNNAVLEHNVFHADVADAMFRQVQNNTAIPFKQHELNTGSLIIKAVDFDMGAQRVAYFDRDTASYHYTPGVNTAGNRGWTYRNDGVDIKRENDDHYIFHIEDGEWLQYTVSVKKAGNYRFEFRTRSDSARGALTILDNEKSWPGLICLHHPQNSGAKPQPQRYD